MIFDVRHCFRDQFVYVFYARENAGEKHLRSRGKLKTVRQRSKWNDWDKKKSSDSLIMIADGCRQASGTNSVACNMNQITEPALRTERDTNPSL